MRSRSGCPRLEQTGLDKNGRKRREPGAEPPLTDRERETDGDTANGDDSDDSSDLGIRDATSRKSMESGWTAGTDDTSNTTNTGMSEKDVNKQNKKTEERKQRGLMQWKPARNLKFGMRKLKNKITGGLEGRQPGVETETG
jgi:hypothetical protein